MKNIELNEFKLPRNLNNDCDYIEDLFDILDEYENNISESFNKESYIITSLQENIKWIKDSMKFYYNGAIDKAKNNIYNILDKYKDNSFIVSDINKSYAFRGTVALGHLKIPGYKYTDAEQELSFFRTRIGREGFTKEDMLHIPFDKRELVKTQRFSIPGLPCIYLGTTTYCCWLEVGRPPDDSFDVSSYKLPQKLQILNLVGEQHLINGHSNYPNMGKPEYEKENKRLLEAMIEFFPVIIATSYTIKNRERDFKSEYIISQLIMQCLEEFNIDGIAYISKRVKGNVTGYPHNVNLAIPMKQKEILGDDKEKYSLQFNDIEFTEPVNLSEYTKNNHSNSCVMKETFINRYFNHPDHSRIHLGGREVNYGACIFSRFDNYIYSLKHKVFEL